MIYELICSNTPKGIFKDTKGFCAVAVTEKMPAKLVRPLIDLAKKQVQNQSQYRVGPKDFFAHFPLSHDGKKVHVLTRGTHQNSDQDTWDFVVHQIILSESELNTAGPAAVLGHEPIWFTRWETSPQILAPRKIEVQPLAPRICRMWEEHTGDSGWAGMPFESYETDKACMLLTEASLPVSAQLKLLVESQSLVPKELRWKILISIGAWHPFKTDHRFWSIADRGTQAAVDSMSNQGCNRIDISRELVRSGSRYATQARDGQWILPKKRPTAPSRSTESNSSTKLMVAESPNEDAYELAKEPEKLDTPIQTQEPKVVEPDQELQENSQDITNQAPNELDENDSAVTSTTRISPRTKLILCGAGTFILLLAVWLGYGFLNGVAETLNEAKNPPVPIIRQDESNKNDGSEVDSNPLGREDKKENDEFIVPVEGLTPVNVGQFLNRIESQPTTIPFNNDEHFLFEYPTANEQVEDFVELSILLPNRRMMLNRDPQIDLWPVNSVVNGKRVTIASIKTEVDYEADVTRFIWNWGSSDIERPQVNEIQSGWLIANVDGAPGELHIPLTKATTNDRPFRFIDFQFKSAFVKPHLASYLTKRAVYDRYKWAINEVQLKELSAHSPDAIWEPAVFDNGLFKIKMKSDVVFSNAAKVLGVTIVAASEEEESEISVIRKKLQELIDSHGPFGIESKLRLIPRETEESVQVNSVASVIIASPGEDHSPIYISGSTGFRAEKPKTIAAHHDLVRLNLAQGLARFFGIEDGPFREHLMSDGKGLSKFTGDKKVAAALASVLYQHLHDAINSDVEIGLERRLTSPKTLSIQALKVSRK